MIEYLVDVSDRLAHRFAVQLRFNPSEGTRTDQGLTVSLPVWIPGGYMVREFARHLEGMVAKQGRRALTLTPLDKTTWRITAPPGQAGLGDGVITITYRVYALDASVRTAWLDADRGFFNGTSLFLRVHGAEPLPHAVTVSRLPTGWRVATAMTPDGEPQRYRAANYDELLDHPFELGDFWQGEFRARGVEHQVVVSGAWPGFDGERLVADAQRICETQIDFWHAEGAAPTAGGSRRQAARAPFARYVFMLHLVDEGYGGLEHRASTALIASRRDVPQQRAQAAPASKGAKADPPRSEGYVTLLGLISHEYFHSWNVKRLKPADHAVLDYARENHTELLWFFEGFTSYYDDLLLRRSGLIDDAQYLKLLGKQINAVIATPGRFKQSVAASSFDAWTKYYRQDENSVNSIVSYYAKGALVAQALDLTMRVGDRGHLDAVMRCLWQRTQGGPIDEAAILDALQSVAGRSLSRELKAWVHGTDDGPWLALLQRMGVDVAQAPVPGLAARWGVRASESASGIQIKHVLAGSLAERSGLSAGDEVLAVAGWRVRKLDDAMAWCRADQAVVITVVRHQRLREVKLKPLPFNAKASTMAVTLSLAVRADAATVRKRTHWLAG